MILRFFLKTSSDTDHFTLVDNYFHTFGPVVMKLLSEKGDFLFNGTSYCINEY